MLFRSPGFKSVEEILKGTPFQVVTPAQYKARTKTGKVVGFFYESANVAGADGWRAKNFKDAIDPKLGLTYLAIPRSASVPDTEYLSLELFTSPAYYLYHNGQKVFSAGGGDPNPSPEVFAKETEILKNNLRVLNGMK